MLFTRVPFRLVNQINHSQTECQNREEEQLSLIQHTLILFAMLRDCFAKVYFKACFV